MENNNDRPDNEGQDRKPYGNREGFNPRQNSNGDQPRTNTGGGNRPRTNSNYNNSGDRPRTPYNTDRPARPYNSGNNTGGDRPQRPYNPDGQSRPYNSDRPARPYNGGNNAGGDRPQRPYNPDGQNRPYNSDRPARPYNSDRPARPYNSDNNAGGSGDRPRRPYNPDGQNRPYNSDRPARPYNADNKGGSGDRPRRPYNPDGQNRPYNSDRPARPYNADGKSGERGGRPNAGSPTNRGFARDARKGGDFNGFKPKAKNTARPFTKYEGDAPEYDISKFKDIAENQNRFRNEKIETENNGEIRLNRYLANAGICSRRDADMLIQQGEVTINGEKMTELGYKVKRGDDVRYAGRRLSREKNVYVLLNKPKDFITTTNDPMERKTVMQLVSNAGKERIYPVGRLDRNTTGLLLLTNDGDISQKLAHPSSKIRKIYEVTLETPITNEDFETLQAGVTLYDGFIKPDEVAIVGDKTVLGIEIHSGKNRIVRRIFEHLGYTVERLDRVMYANLTKKDLPRGHWRFLTEKEVINLKYFV